MTIRECLRKTKETLTEADIEAPALEAGVILCHILNCGRTYLYTHEDKELSAAETETLKSILEQRTKRVPLQYILGHTEFMSLDFVVSPAVLVPRQDTEILVEKCIELVNSLSNDKFVQAAGVKVLDMCTGSGCIAVSIAHYCPQCSVTACDVSQDALDTAGINSRQAGVENRLELRQGDLFGALDGGERFDIIASNPPYIETSAIGTLQKEVRDHEPGIALDGGADGLDFYRRIIDAAPEYLNASGYLVLEIGYNQGTNVGKLMESSFEGITVLKDLGRNDRVVVGRMKNSE